MKVIGLLDQKIEKLFRDGSVSERYSRVRLLLHFFYFVQFTVAYQALSFNAQMPNWITLAESGEMFMPLWPVQWMTWFDYALSVKVILIGFLCSSILSLLFWQRARWIRILSLVAILNYLALISSFGKIDHYLHLMTVTNIFLVFLPNRPKSEANLFAYLRIFWFIQFFILMTYFVSGFFKLFGIFDQVFRGQISALSPTSLGQNVAKTEFYTSKSTFFADFILSNPNYLFSILLILGYFIETFAILAAFKPRLHRITGLLLILLHTGILLSVGPDFYYQILVVGIFLLFSPFAKQDEIVPDNK